MTHIILLKNTLTHLFLWCAKPIYEANGATATNFTT